MLRAAAEVGILLKEREKYLSQYKVTYRFYELNFRELYKEEVQGRKYTLDKEFLLNAVLQKNR